MGIVGATDGTIDKLMHPYMQSFYEQLRSNELTDRAASAWINSRMSPNGANHIPEYKTGIPGECRITGKLSEFVLKPRQGFLINKELLDEYKLAYYDLSRGDGPQVMNNGVPVKLDIATEGNLVGFFSMAARFDGFISWKMFKVMNNTCCFGLMCLSNPETTGLVSLGAESFAITCSVFTLMLRGGVLVPAYDILE